MEKPLLNMAKLQLGLGGSWTDWGDWGRQGQLPEGLPGRGILVAPAPAGAKLPGKQGQLREDKEAQGGHSAENPSLQVFIPALCIDQQPVVLAQLFFLWCMDGAWFSTLFCSGYNAGNLVAFPILCFSPYTTNEYLRNITLENCLCHGYVCKCLCVGHRSLLVTETVKRNTFGLRLPFI